MKVDPAYCPHVRTEGFQCSLAPKHLGTVHIDSHGETWPMHLPFAEASTEVEAITEQEVDRVVRLMRAHGHEHHYSNTRGRACTEACHMLALKDSINAVLEARGG